MSTECPSTIVPFPSDGDAPAYHRARDGRIRYLSRRAWNDLPLDVLTEVHTRLDIERLLDLGYVLQSNANGTITFWHLQTPLDAGNWGQRWVHIQILVEMGALYPAEATSSNSTTLPPGAAQ